MNPKVSVIVPAYNAENWIAYSLQSILDQSHTNLELIVVNDGSTDGTEKIIKGFKDPRIFYYQQANKGQCAACNTGLQYATGDYIKFFDADDGMNAIHIESQLKKLAGSKTAIASCAWGKFFDGNPGSASFVPETVWKDMEPLAWLKASLSQKKDMMGGCLWLIPKELLKKVGGWDERLSLNNDFEFSIRLLLQAKMVLFAEEAKIFYRSGNTNSLSKTLSRKSIEAAILTTELGCNYLLEAENSAAMQLICANRYQDWIFQFYPQHKDLGQKLEKKIAALGKSDIKVQGGKVFHVLKKMLGWKMAKQIQWGIYKAGYLKLLKK